MAVINNWDLTDENNAIYAEERAGATGGSPSVLGTSTAVVEVNRLNGDEPG